MTSPDGAEVTTEYAVRMTDGGMHVRNPHPETDRIYPLDQWIRGQIEVNRGHVYRRRVIVVDDWVEVQLGLDGAALPGFEPGLPSRSHSPGGFTLGPG